MESLKLRIEALTEVLQAEAGKDSLQDRYYAGYIAGLKDLLNISVEEV